MPKIYSLTEKSVWKCVQLITAADPELEIRAWEIEGLPIPGFWCLGPAGVSLIHFSLTLNQIFKFNVDIPVHDVFVILSIPGSYGPQPFSSLQCHELLKASSTTDNVSSELR